jgi:hypothetical protein
VCVRRCCCIANSSGEHDLEGIVGKWAAGPYICDGQSTSWVRVKVKNPNYSQMDGRRELFEQRGNGGNSRRSLPRLMLTVPMTISSADSL